MKDKVLRLCKRLDKFTLDEIGTISELNSEVLLPLLGMFVKNKKLIKKGKIYQYNKNASSYLAKNRLPQRYQHHSKQDIDYMIKCFCADVEAKKVMTVFNFGKYVVNMFYQSFRQALYQKQKDELLRWLKVKPKIPQEREYMGTTVYLYLYNNKLYVLEKPIRTKEPKKHTEEERLLIKNIYLRSYRKVLSRSFAFKFHLHLCEEIWKYGKDYDEQYTAINNILFA